jgi:hypothetical protein
MMGVCEMDISNTNKKSDAELLNEYRKSRSQQALDQLYLRHESSLASDCYRTIRNQRAAEEAATLALAILARRPDVVSGPVSEWLHEAAYCIARERNLD